LLFFFPLKEKRKKEQGLTMTWQSHGQVKVKPIKKK
jgi:hypothetical protein